MIKYFTKWLLESRGSTRPLGLFRIILMLLLWSRFASQVTLWRAETIGDVILGLAFFVLTALCLIGWQTRRVMALLAALLALMYFHHGLNLGVQPWTHHHVYLLFICTLLTALGPCDRSFSIDRWLQVRQGKASNEVGSLTANHLLILQLAAIYFWTAIDKTNTIFLTGTRLDQILHFHYDGTIFGPLLLWSPLVIGASILVVAIEYALTIAILARRPLILVFITGFALHATFYFILPVSTFSLTMMAIYLMLIPPDRVHNFIDQVTCAGSAHNSLPSES